ncbi:hypothetical protein [Hymenobacter sp. B81]|uniref:hypothetical protein n=1 Tax=Hymenobacter sp. B81 TaxID=3344878 RepID=UPI0037DCE974
MDTTAEIAARASAYLEILSGVVAEWRLETDSAEPTLYGFRSWQQLPAHVPAPALCQRGTELTRGRYPYLVLWPDRPRRVPQALPQDCNWASFCRQGRYLLVVLRTLTKPPVSGGPALADLLKQPEVLPQVWRQQLRRHIYDDPRLARRLAWALDFTPRLLRQLFRDVWAGPPAPDAPPPPPPRNSAELLAEPDNLRAYLAHWRCAVPFAYVYAQELEDVLERRRQLHRKQKLATTLGSAAPPEPVLLNPRLSPWDQARQLGLFGLGLSGGGIRSASFNLGVIQALAVAGGLPRLDYLSTISGGGYVGSWLVAWIRRLGSVTQVQHFLHPRRTSNPRSEEQRPLRWLRSYSNYLAPEASALSVDLWTVGLTWLRNTLLNQLVLALALGALLGLSYLLLLGWQHAWQSPRDYRLWGGLLLVTVVAGCVSLAKVVAFFYRRQERLRPPEVSSLTIGLLAFELLLIGYLASAYAVAHPQLPLTGLAARLVFGVLLAGLGAVAYFGRYHRSYLPPTPRAWHQQLWAWRTRLVLATVISAAAGTLLLWGAAGLLTNIANWQSGQDSKGLHWPPLTFVLGMPLMVEALALTVTLRMGLLGRHIPDDRREWWGRLGALVQLLLLAWLVFSGLSLLAPPIIREALPPTGIGGYALPASLAGWMLLVAKGVQWAQSTVTPAQPDQPAKPRSGWRDLVARFAPYAFALGLLLLLSWGVGALLPVLEAWLTQSGADFSWQSAGLLTVGAALLALLLAYCLGVNEFSMHHFYRNRLTRAYLGASRRASERQASAFTGFDPDDDLKLSRLVPFPDPAAAPSTGGAVEPPGYDGPLPIIGAALNITRGQDLANQDRKAESFVFTPRYCGFDFARLRPAPDPERAAEFGFRPTPHYAYPDGPALGTAMTISGAAANPNMGYHSSPVTAFLLTVFNVRLGWWMGNPRSRHDYRRADPRSGLFYLFYDLLGRATADRDFVNLSDGGHFDNLGLYELVRRRCRYIILSDAEEDEQMRCEGLANAIRRCRVDFGVEITLDTRPVRDLDSQDFSAAHAVRGRIHYPDWPAEDYGQLLYLKASLTGDEPIDVLHYAAENPDFPHQSTGDQFFTESQLESYRALGFHIAHQLLPTLDDQFTPDRLFALPAATPTAPSLRVGPNGRLHQENSPVNNGPASWPDDYP